MPIPIGTIGNVPTITVGGRVFTDLANLIIVGGPAASTGNFTTLRRQNGTSGYQVTAGKTYTIAAVKTISAAAGNGSITLLYGNTDIGINGASAPTTPIYAYGGTAAAPVILAQCSVASGGSFLGTTEVPCDFAVPATKFPAVLNIVTTASVLAYGYET